jgi:hypothetical protein
MKNIGKKQTSNYLMSISFITGLGSVMGIFGNYYSSRSHKALCESDKKAIASDWLTIGHDFEEAIGELEESHRR